MNETSTGGPLPSRHVFLHELVKLAAGTKVRCLGCVVDYEISTASLILEHAFPQSTIPVPQASLDVGLVLESLKFDDLQRGSWLNVIGYVRRPERREKKTRSTTDGVKSAAVPTIEAIVVWSAGAIKVADYEAALLSHKEARKDCEVPVVA